MNKPLFTGVCTALVTPFLNGEINYPMLQQLIERQLDAGIEAIVIGGTTGEAATLTDSEKYTLFRRAKEYAGSRCRILAGTGSNSTAHAITLSRAAEDAGADGLLVVSPYYNKASQEGIEVHYQAIAEQVNIPMILYNVPSRTGVDISVATYQQLAAVPNIVGVKEAKPELTKIIQIRASCPDAFTVWSGNDDLTVPILSVGGKGVISVVSNILPEITQGMVKAGLDGDFDTASALQIQLLPLIQALFSDVNPIPVKAALQLIGFDCGPCRLPLTAAKAESVSRLKSVLGV